MTELFARSPLARRLAALAILALLLVLSVPLLVSPFTGFGERAEAIETEAALLERLDRLEARRASLASLAAVANPPFLVAADAGAALEALQARLSGVVAPDRLRIESLAPLPRDERPGTPKEKPGAPVEVQLGFSATESGLYAFLADLETRPPFVRVRELSVKSALDGSVRVARGTAILSAVPFPTASP
ncbi:MULTISPECIES: type II secretion system protein GspM [unclassified Aureimonas]|uniref:type II secretion system protein GspM n=1 Tax=unclassified Aureimonas TaxID=2615206 RepID=UPI0006F2794E|nr:MULTISPECIES: type II secretion system protein GspM [unclassified Aureimonas]KQT69874.1 hypothetical protein ASG62_01865 [Aureimonas sp. Leaf427]KQT75972.1 hypothetical protein ASG54_14355 [Aureimonas sp. Leaf460]